VSQPDDIPLDYKWIDWEHLYLYVGRALLGDHVPLMTKKVADYLENQAKEMRRKADKLDVAAQALRREPGGSTKQ
jgi:hypothetical protein